MTFSQFNATAAPARLEPRRDRVPRHQGDAVPASATATRSCPTCITPNEFPARTPVDRALERGYRVGRQAADRAAEGAAARPTRPTCTPATSSTASRSRQTLQLRHRESATATPRAALIGNIAHKTKSYLEWDAKAETLHQQRRRQPAAAPTSTGRRTGCARRMGGKTCRMPRSAGTFIARCKSNDHAKRVT